MTTTPARDPFAPVTLTATCLHLRHKLMYVDDRHATPGLVDDSSSTRVFLCLQSHDALGPDGEPVSPSLCSASRPCHCPSPHTLTAPPTTPTTSRPPAAPAPPAS